MNIVLNNMVVFLYIYIYVLRCVQYSDPKGVPNTTVQLAILYEFFIRKK